MSYLRLCIVAASFLALAGCAGLPLGGSQRVYSEAPRQQPARQQPEKAAPPVAYRTQPGEVAPKVRP